MSVDKKIIQEIEKYNSINRYISEQEEPVDSAANLTGGESDEPTNMDLGGDEMGDTTPIDVDNDPDVEVVGEPDSESTETLDDEGTGTEELDITDLVTTQKDMSSKQEEYMETMMDRLNDLTNKLDDMDQILTKINSLEQKVEKYRQKSPEEKLSLRSLDSYPYNQKLTDYFSDKEVEMEKTGKNEYILTPDDVENYSEGDIKKSFDRPFEDDYKM